MIESGGDDEGHLSDARLAAFLDRGLTPAERASVEEHLSRCAACRAHVVASQELLSEVRRPWRSRVGGSLIAAAAVVLLAVGLTARGGSRVAPDPVVRGGADARLIAYGPTGETSARALRFVWGATPGAVTYRLSVTRADGAAVWSHSGADTSVALPDSVVLARNRHYFWMADALLGDGSSRSTGVRRFDAVP